MSTSDWLKLISIPLFTSATGWLINWTGLTMLLHPVRFHDVRIPGLQELSTLLQRKLREVPGSCPEASAGPGSFPPEQPR